MHSRNVVANGVDLFMGKLSEDPYSLSEHACNVFVWAWSL